MKVAALPAAERVARLRLARSLHIGPASHAALIAQFGSAEAAIAALQEGLGGRYARVRLADESAVERELAKADRFGAQIVLRGEPDYPPLLAELPDAPAVVTLLGAPAVFLRPALAIVGARNASLAGMRLTRGYAEAAGTAGMAIISGLARGIDTAAHEGGLATGTAGIFAGGLDRPYPPENKGLMRRIVDHGGCLISEMPFGHEPRAVDFPRRNRLIAGLAQGLLVVEAALRSGSLISARLAHEMGRPVLAVPGSPLDNRAAGPNLLIRNGAALICDAADILAVFNMAPAVRQTPQAPFGQELAGDDSPKARILEALGTVPVSLDDLIAHVGCTPPVLYRTLMELDLAARLQRHPDGRVSLCG